VNSFEYKIYDDIYNIFSKEKALDSKIVAIEFKLKV